MGACMDKAASDGQATKSGGVRFPVKNLGGDNRIIGEGTIEVTDSELLLYSGGTEPLKWPLRYLRRYGFDQGLFSFEAGRRCTSGEGIFAFATKHPEKIFKLVENNLRQQPKSGDDDPDEAAPRNGSRGQVSSSPRASEEEGGQVEKPVKAGPLNYVKLDLGGVETTGGVWPIRNRTAYAQLDLNKMDDDKEPGKAAPAASDAGRLNYVQVDFDQTPSAGSFPAPAPVRTQYNDVRPHAPASKTPSGPKFEMTASSPTGPRDSVSGQPFPVASSAGGMSGGQSDYTTIDFDATSALTGLREDAQDRPE